MVEHIRHGTETIAILVREAYSKPGVTFFTSDEYSQQLAYMNHPAGKIIQPHVHNPVLREIQHTMEVLIVKRGKLRVDFYSCQQAYLESRTLEAGDFILLASGGHGFTALEDLEMIEVKQGPFVGGSDKIRFAGTAADQPS